jgi:hypothetical protein
MAYSRSDDPDTYDIIGAAMAVHSELGCGYLEADFGTKSLEYKRVIWSAH